MTGLWLNTFTTCFFLFCFFTCGEQIETNITCKICDGYQVCGGTNKVPYCEGLPCTKEQYESCLKSFAGEFICDTPGLFVSLQSPREFYECNFYAKKPKLFKKVGMCPPQREFCPHTMRCLTKEEKKIAEVLLTTYKNQKFKKTNFTCTEPGIYSNDFDCKKYYWCEWNQGIPAVFSCRVNTYFDKNLKLCVNHLSVNCANNLRMNLNRKISEADELYEEVRNRINQKQKFRMTLYKYMRWVSNISLQRGRRPTATVIKSLLNYFDKQLDIQIYLNSNHIAVLEQRVREMENSLKKIMSFIMNTNKNLGSLLRQVAYTSSKNNADADNGTFTFNKNIVNTNENVSTAPLLPPYSKTVSERILTETETSSEEISAQTTQEPFKIITEPLAETSTLTEQVLHKFFPIVTNNPVIAEPATRETLLDLLFDVTSSEFDTISSAKTAEVSKREETKTDSTITTITTVSPLSNKIFTTEVFQESSPGIGNTAVDSQTESTTDQPTDQPSTTTEKFTDSLINETAEFETTSTPLTIETTPIFEKTTAGITSAPLATTNPPTVPEFRKSSAAQSTETTSATLVPTNPPTVPEFRKSSAAQSAEITSAPPAPTNPPTVPEFRKSSAAQRNNTVSFQAETATSEKTTELLIKATSESETISKITPTVSTPPPRAKTTPRAKYKSKVIFLSKSNTSFISQMASTTTEKTTQVSINKTGEFQTTSTPITVKPAATSNTTAAPFVQTNPPATQDLKEFSPVRFVTQTEPTQKITDLIINATAEFETTQSSPSTEETTRNTTTEETTTITTAAITT